LERTIFIPLKGGTFPFHRDLHPKESLLDPFYILSDAKMITKPHDSREKKTK